jgi:hypothetical protein
MGVSVTTLRYGPLAHRPRCVVGPNFPPPGPSICSLFSNSFSLVSAVSGSFLRWNYPAENAVRLPTFDAFHPQYGAQRGQTS